MRPRTAKRQPRPRLRLAFVLVLLLGLLSPVFGVADTGGAGLKPDVRLLIDVSGSMKTSDPDNLRAPAVEMLVRMLPQGSRAGIWLFAEEAIELVPHGEVDTEWRARARRAMARIDNSGQRTNIPAALAAATFDFDRLDPGYRVSVVLLTDGKVDVGESPMLNASAARELLAGTAVELGHTGVPVHTIALSAEADWAFLRSLAQATSGIAEQVESADALGAVFLQSLEMVAPTARVPVEGSRFSIDASVEEFTALVFFPKGRQRVRVVTPGGDEFGPQDSRDGVDWAVNAQFGLVTVTDPEPGEWAIQVASGNSIRVTVISDLQLEVDPLPNSMPSGRQAEIGLRLTEGGKPLLDAEVIETFALFLEIEGPDGSTERIDVTGNYDLPADGEYRVLLPPFVQSGRYQIMVRLIGDTLQRELPLLVEVAPPPEEATLVTRGDAPPTDDFRAPLIGLAVGLLLVLAVIWWILRRRKKRKLAIWQKRAELARTNGTGEFPMAGVSAEEQATKERLD